MDSIYYSLFDRLFNNEAVCLKFRDVFVFFGVSTIIFDFLVSQILGINLFTNLSYTSGVLSVLNPHNAYHFMEYSVFGGAWVFHIFSSTISFVPLESFFIYVAFPFYYIIGVFYVIVVGIIDVFSDILAPFSYLPYPFSALMQSLFLIIFFITLITSIRIISSQLGGD